MDPMYEMRRVPTIKDIPEYMESDAFIPKAPGPEKKASTKIWEMIERKRKDVKSNRGK